MAAKLGYTRRQLLANIDAQELADWLIMENLSYWDNRIKEAAIDDEERSQQMLSLMFGNYTRES